MKIIHVVASISLESSGPSQSVPALCQGLAAEGVDVELHYIDYGGRPTVPGVGTFAYDRTRIPGLRFAAWNIDLLAALIRKARPGTIFHAHGLWEFPTIYPAWVGAVKGVPWVCSPRGTLSDWAMRRSTGKKAISLALGQRYALQHANLLHATSEAEADDIRKFGVAQEILVVPNAVPPAPRRFEGERSRRHLLFMSRLHPKKALERLIDAWNVVAPSFPESRLLIAGPSEDGYGEGLEASVRERHVPRVQFLGPLAGDEKWTALSDARALVLPSHNENFAMVVAEALAAGTPVIASKGTPWSSLVDAGAGWWVENSVAELTAALRECLSEDVPTINSRGERGRQLVEGTMSTQVVARAMIRGYERITGGKSY